MSRLKLLAAGVTDVGRVRDGNEDDFLDQADRLGLVAVADGMGGHRAGEVASATALEALRAAVASGEGLRDAIEGANEAVLEKSESDRELQGMGTTLTAGMLGTDGSLMVGHVGDSRAYLIREGELRQITDDHSLVEEMVRGGELTPEQAEVHPQRSIITRALGIDPQVDVDVYPIELEPGDRILLCSDGLTTMLRPDEIANILGREQDSRRAAQLLVDAANAAGGEDNVTAVIVEAVEVTEDEAVAAPVVDDEQDVTDMGVRPPKRRRRRGRTLFRVAIWALPILLVLAVAFGFVGWYARNSYYVGINRGRVTVFQGIKGGLLIWDPTVERRTTIQADNPPLTGAQLQDVKDGKKFSSRSDADAYVARLRRQVEATTATAPPATTAPPPPAAPPS
ncbi:MAG TPA: Stp1/IreP family PP2C-type Ser/Thr phosphatase [Acidimicrobiia bacterium]|nr:Stp1/IreP family PP2C-type Ser/Thr phosphatase [Acidimicrobiia bacterium]